MEDSNVNEPIVIGRIETPKQFSQLGVLVIDGSGSMGETAKGNITKAQATNNATRELFTRFKASRVARNFSFAVITFDDHATIRLEPTEVGPQLDDNGDYNPLKAHGGGTRIYTALEIAGNMAIDFIANAPKDGVPHNAVILLMSDGCCSDPAKTRRVADSIKHGDNANKIKICTALFATIGHKDLSGEELLKQISNDPVMGYKTVYDSDNLRDFFQRSSIAASGAQIG